MDKGCKVVQISKKDNHIDLNILMRYLGEEEKIDSILLEGGGSLNWSALNSHIVNKVQTYISPKIFGGIEAKSPVSGIGVENPNHAFYLKNTSIKNSSILLSVINLVKSSLVNALDFVFTKICSDTTESSGTSSAPFVFGLKVLVPTVRLLCLIYTIYIP